MIAINNNKENYPSQVRKKNNKERNKYFGVGIAVGIIVCMIGLGIFSMINKMPQKTKAPDRVLMGWDYSGDINFVSKPAVEAGYNVVSPIWYTIDGSKTDIDKVRLIKKTKPSYVKKAHQNGYQVWAMLSDGFSPTRSKLIFDNPDKRDEIIKTIVDDVVKNDIDGVNVDFEGDGRKNTEGFTKFVSILAKELKKEGKVISVDVTGYDNSMMSSYYDRTELAKIVDYIAIMAYDEHWAKSDVAGSVSSIDWVRGNIEKTLEEVPSEKIILSVPFYTRSWRIVQGKNVIVSNSFVNVRSEANSKSDKLGSPKKGQGFKYLDTVKGQKIGKVDTWYKINYDGKEGYVLASFVDVVNYGERGKVSSKAYGIKYQDGIINKYKPEVKFDQASGQNLATYSNLDGSITKIWLEDETSMAARMDLVKEYKLAGIAAWRLGYEDQTIWDVINRELSK